MRIECDLLEVLESMPLQLIVESESKRLFVSLRAGTLLSRAGSPVDAGQLLPGMRLVIEGPAAGQPGLTANTIEIIA